MTTISFPEKAIPEYTSAQLLASSLSVASIQSDHTQMMLYQKCSETMERSPSAESSGILAKVHAFTHQFQFRLLKLPFCWWRSGQVTSTQRRTCTATSTHVCVVKSLIAWRSCGSIFNINGGKNQSDSNATIMAKYSAVEKISRTT
jgi:hypothetical protein